MEVSSAHSVSNRERAEERKECARNTVEDPCSDCARIVEVSSEHPRDIRDTRLPGPSPRPRLGAQMMRGAQRHQGVTRVRSGEESSHRGYSAAARGA